MTYRKFIRIPITRGILARIFSKVKISTELFYNGEPCWEWTGYRNDRGYGVKYYQNKSRLAHNVIFQLFYKILEPGQECDHLCRVRHCVNPMHIEAVTHAVNTLRGIGPTAINAQKTHCPKGHELTPDNTMVNKNRRRCRSCHLKWHRDHPSFRDRKATYRKFMELPYDHPDRIKERERHRLKAQKHRDKLKLANIHLDNVPAIS